MDDRDDVEIPLCLPRRTPEQWAEIAAKRREAALNAFRERRARRIAELGLGSHRRDP